MLEEPQGIAISLAELRREMVRQGLTRKATARILFELAVHVSCVLVGGWMFLATPYLLLHIAGIFLSAWGCVGIASNSHTSSHYGTSSHRWVNEALTFFGYAFCLGLSARYWWADHRDHHNAPNVIGLDDDFDYAPLFTIDATTIAQARGWKLWYYQKVQAILFPCAVLLLGFNMQRRAIGWLYRNRKGAWGPTLLDASLIAAHFAVFIALPAAFFGLPNVLLFYCLRMLVEGAGLFAILSPAHFPADAYILTQAAARGLGHCELQTFTTLDYSGGWLLRWITSGLGYQIEHHLFPEISHTNYPAVTPLVRAFCEANQLPHRTYPFPKAISEALRVFREPKEPVPAAEPGCNVFADRLPAVKQSAAAGV